MSRQKVVVIGGGVIGLSTAYHLARRGVQSVTLLEKGKIGEGASLRAAGIITSHLWSETGVRARLLSLELFHELSTELEGYQFRDVGCLNFFDSTSWPERAEMLPLYDRLSVPYEILDHEQIQRRWPQLTPDAETIALLDPQGGYSEPDEYVPGLARRVSEMGVHIREETTVLDLLFDGDRIAGVMTPAGPIHADVVVSTVHVWTLQLLARKGLVWPVKAFVHQRYLSETFRQDIRLPAVNAHPLGGYLRPASDNRILVGVETPQREEVQVDSSFFRMDELSVPGSIPRSLASRFSPLVSLIQQTTWPEERIGLIQFSIDGEPILGPVAAIPGLYVGLAFHSGGFAYNPVAGLLLSEWILDGRPHLDLSIFSPDRFSDEVTRSYLERRIVQANAVTRRH